MRAQRSSQPSKEKEWRYTSATGMGSFDVVQRRGDGHLRGWRLGDPLSKRQRWEADGQLVGPVVSSEESPQLRCVRPGTGVGGFHFDTNDESSVGLGRRCSGRCSTLMHAAGLSLPRPFDPRLGLSLLCFAVVFCTSKYSTRPKTRMWGWEPATGANAQAIFGLVSEATGYSVLQYTGTLRVSP